MLSDPPNGTRFWDVDGVREFSPARVRPSGYRLTDASDCFVWQDYRRTHWDQVQSGEHLRWRIRSRSYWTTATEVFRTSRGERKLLRCAFLTGQVLRWYQTDAPVCGLRLLRTRSRAFVVACTTRGLRRFDDQTGALLSEVRWSEPEVPCAAQLVFDGERWAALFMRASDASLLLIDEEKGVLWRKQVSLSGTLSGDDGLAIHGETPFRPMLAFCDGLVFSSVGSRWGGYASTLQAHSVSDGTLRWSAPSTVQDYAFYEDRLFHSSRDSLLERRAHDGALLRELMFPAPVHSIATARDVVYVTTDHGPACALDPASLKPYWTLHFPDEYAFAVPDEHGVALYGCPPRRDLALSTTPLDDPWIARVPTFSDVSIKEIPLRNTTEVRSRWHAPERPAWLDAVAIVEEENGELDACFERLVDEQLLPSSWLHTPVPRFCERDDTTYCSEYSPRPRSVDALVLYASDPDGVRRAELLSSEIAHRFCAVLAPCRETAPRWHVGHRLPETDWLRAFYQELQRALPDEVSAPHFARAYVRWEQNEFPKPPLGNCALLCAELQRFSFLWNLAQQYGATVQRPSAPAYGKPLASLADPIEPLLELLALGYPLVVRPDRVDLYCPPQLQGTGTNAP